MVKRSQPAKNTKKRVQPRLGVDLYDWIEDQARSEGITMAAWIRRLLMRERRRVEENEKGTQK